MDKKEIKKIFKNLEAKVRSESKALSYNAPDAERTIKSKALDKAYKIFASCDVEKIQEYLSGEFLTLPDYAQSQIVYATCHLTDNGESIYSNLITSKTFNLWKYFDNTNTANEDRHSLSTYAKMLLKTALCPRASADLFAIYSNNATYGSIEDLLTDIKEFGEIRTSDNRYYIQIMEIRTLIGEYAKQNPKNIEEFYQKLTESFANSPRFNDSNFLSSISTYLSFFNESNAYENYKYLISQNHKIKEGFYESANPNYYGFNAFTKVLKTYSDEDRLKFISEYVQDEMFQPTAQNANLIISYIKNNISNKNLLVNFDLCMPIYKVLAKTDDGPPIASLFIKGKIPYLSQSAVNERFKRSEEKMLSAQTHLQSGNQSEEERLSNLIKEYYTCGAIDINTYNEVLLLGMAFNKNLDLQQLKSIIAKNENLRNIVEDIATQPSEVSRTAQTPSAVDDVYPIWIRTPYEKALYDLSKILPKTRFSALPEINAYKKMSPSLKSKFNLKVWNQFASLPLFNKDDNTKRALVEFIAVMGLFEDDPNVEQRRKKAYEMVSSYNLKLTHKQLRNYGIYTKLLSEYYSKEDIAKALNKPVEALLTEEIESYITADIFVPCKIKEYRIRPNVEIPEGLKSSFNSIIGVVSESYYGELKKLTGSYGKKMGDFLSPYAKVGNTYKLKHGVVVPEGISSYLAKELTAEQYNSLLQIEEVAAFLNPLQEVSIDGYTTNPKLPKEKRDAIYSILYSCDLPDYLDFGTIHRMFDGCNQVFDEKLYNMLSNNMGLLLEDDKKQSAVKSLQRMMDSAIDFYKANGNSQPTLLDIFTYMEAVPFVFDYGYNEFATLAKNAGIKTQSTYDRYQALMPKLQSRKKTTIPRHEKTYTYVDKNGKEYKIMTKILRLDDPMTMLVGESNFTNCCQVYGNAGESCMVHASTSENGGIFAVYLINEQGVPEMLTQSWIWTRETKLCLDNVEATALITDKSGEEKRLYQDMATFGIIQASNDIIATSEQSVDKFIEERTKKIMASSTLSNEQKQEELKKLEILRQRQTLQIVTVGEGCDDLNVVETFKQRESVELSQGPKGFDGYRDSDVINDKSKQHIVVQTGNPILPVDENYQDVPIYRDERRITHLSGRSITQEMLKRITDIESTAHKKEMLSYTDKQGPVLKHPQALANICECNLNDLHILVGEDWYFIYSDDGDEIQVYDFAKREPRLEDEANEQQNEMSLAFNTILGKSVVLDENGNVIKVKKIKAELREDTSYLLYLFQKRRGIIAQVGQDMRYEFKNSETQVPVSDEEQVAILKNFSKVREEQNPNLMMHKVEFVPTDKTIKKIVDNTLANLQGRSST